MAKKHYAERDIEALGKHYMDHVEAMTAERLHEKSDIAAELAYRDARLENCANLCKKRIEECYRILSVTTCRETGTALRTYQRILKEIEDDKLNICQV
jgi:L-amino acid N-acyltransferase YncA